MALSKSSYFYLDPALRHKSHSAMKHTSTSAETDDYRPGDLVEVWDHVFTWTADCAPRQKWLQWRFEGDRLLDAALPYVLDFELPNDEASPSNGYSAPPSDLLARLQMLARSRSCPPAVMAFWNHLHPSSLEPKTHPSPSDFVMPSAAQIKRGQDMFYRNAPQILASLLHFSLSAGFSSPRISRILNLASYLVPPMASSAHGDVPRISQESNDRSFMRLMETTQWMIDCMGDGALDEGGQGWQSTVRVRMLHGTMRRRLQQKSRKEVKEKGHSVFEEERDGVPISQEDMIGTLVAFSATPMISLMKMGITSRKQELEDWTALWRAIGYLFGIDPTVLALHFGSWTLNASMAGSTFTNIFAGETDPPPPCHFPFEIGLIPSSHLIPNSDPRTVGIDPYTSPATLPVLFCIVDRWPMPFTFGQHCAAARFLMGPSLSDWLSVPKSGLYDHIQYRLGNWALHIPVYFGRVWRSGWDFARRNAMRRSVETAVRMQLGNRHSKFRPRAPDAFAPVKEGDEYFGVNTGGSLGSTIWMWVPLYGEFAVGVTLMAMLWPVSIPYVWWQLSRAE